MSNLFMKKKPVILSLAFMLVVFAICLIVSNSYAVEENKDTNLNTSSIGNLVLDCTSSSGSKKILPSENMVCILSAKNFTTQVSSFSADLVLGNNLTLKESEIIDNDTSSGDEDWLGSVSGGNIDLYTGINKIDNFSIAKFVIQTGDINTGFDTKISLKNVVISDESFDEIKLDDIATDVRICSTVATLNSLDVSGIAIDFNPGIYTYVLNTEMDEVTIRATTADKNAKISGQIGTHSLNFGVNTFTLTVISEAGNELVYRLNITREQQLSFSNDVVVDDVNKNLKFMCTLSVNDLLKKINTNGTSKVVNTNDVEVKENDLISTGYRVNVLFSNAEYEYTIIVMGDTNGDGSISVTDVSRLFQHYRGTTVMDEIYVLAGDVEDDDEVKLNDVAKLFQYVRGTITSLE